MICSTGCRGKKRLKMTLKGSLNTKSPCNINVSKVSGLFTFKSDLLSIDLEMILNLKLKFR